MMLINIYIKCQVLIMMIQLDYTENISMKFCLRFKHLRTRKCIWKWRPFGFDVPGENALRAHALRWRHNGCDSVSNHQPHDCLLNRLFRRRSKKTSRLRVTGLCAPHKWPVTRKMFPFDDVIMCLHPPCDIMLTTDENRLQTRGVSLNEVDMYKHWSRTLGIKCCLSWLAAC